jgi:O-antigen ligase
MSLRDYEKWAPVGPLVPLLVLVPWLRDSASFFNCPVGSMVLICGLELLFCYLVVMGMAGPVISNLSPKVTLLLSVWGLAAVLAVAQADLVFPAIARQTEWLCHILFALYLARYLRVNPRLNALLPALVLAGFLLTAGQLLAAWHTTTLPRQQSWINLIPGFRNIRFFGMYLVPALLFPLLFVCKSQERGIRALPIFLYSSFCWALVFWTGGRGLLLSLVATIVLLGKVVKSPRRQWLAKFAGGSAILGMVLSVLYFVPGQSIFSLARWQMGGTVDEFSSSRISIWQEVWRSYLEQPWFGFGPDGYAYMQPKVELSMLHPHNIILQFLGEWGVIGGAALLLLLITGMRNIVARIKLDADPERRIIRTAALGVITCLLFLSLVSGSFYYPFSLLFVAVAFAVGLQDFARPAPSTTAEAKVYPIRQNVFGRGFIGLLAIIVLLHGTVFGLQFGRAPASPTSFRARLVYYFPSSLEGDGILQWIRAWQDPYPEAAYAWSLWAQQRARAKWYYYLGGAEVLKARGERAAAANSLRQALALCPARLLECSEIKL